jgi:hypothetical protein
MGTHISHALTPASLYFDVRETTVQTLQVDCTALHMPNDTQRGGRETQQASHKLQFGAESSRRSVPMLPLAWAGEVGGEGRNSVAFVSERSYCQLVWIKAATGSAQRIPRPVFSSFLDRSRYSFFQVAPQLYSRGWADPVPDPLLLRKFGTAGNRTGTSGSVAQNSDHIYAIRYRNFLHIRNQIQNASRWNSFLQGTHKEKYKKQMNSIQWRLNRFEP